MVNKSANTVHTLAYTQTTDTFLCCERANLTYHRHTKEINLRHIEQHKRASHRTQTHTQRERERHLSREKAKSRI